MIQRVKVSILKIAMPWRIRCRFESYTVQTNKNFQELSIENHNESLILNNIQIAFLRPIDFTVLYCLLSTNEEKNEWRLCGHTYEKWQQMQKLRGCGKQQ